MSESEISTSELKMENRRLRRYVSELGEMVETLATELEAEKKANGRGPPEDAGPPEFVSRAKECKQNAPRPVDPDRDGILPPWEREGFESKQAWLDAEVEAE